MRSIKALKQELTNLGFMQGILETFEEMAATKMQGIRRELLLAKNYYDGLAGVSSEIGLDIEGVVGPDTIITAMVLFSSNSGMFGTLPERLVVSFAKEIKGLNCDVFVIGEMGARLLKNIVPDQEFRVLSLKGEAMSPETLSNVVEQLRSYRQIKLFYGQFINIVRQDAVSRNLSGELTITYVDPKDREQKQRLLKYLYEPNVEAVSQKIGHEIFGSIFEETDGQSQLAKYAARLIHLDESLANLEKLQKKTHKIKTRFARKIDNRKQGLRLSAVVGTYEN